MSDYTRPERLVSTQWLADHFDEFQVMPIEIVWGESSDFGMPAYERGHVLGAVAWDCEKDFQDPARHDVLDKAGLEALLSRSGISPETTVVVHSGLSNLLATYAFWLLKVYRHLDVRLLDGSRQRWLDENRPTTSQVPKIIPAIYQARKPDWSLRTSRDDVLESIGKANSLLVDARSVEMCSGLDKVGAARGGHIPGVIHLAARRETNPDGPFKAWRVPTVQPDGAFKLAQEQRALLGDLGITPDKDIVTYCVRGGLSTHAWFVMTQLLGYGNVREYDRSWVEWGNLEHVPVQCQKGMDQSKPR